MAKKIREEPTMKDESWDKLLTVFAVASLAALIWWLVTGCSLLLTCGRCGIIIK